MTARGSLRQLCSDYFHGVMSTDTYRQRRTSLLDEAIVPRAIPMEAPMDADTEHAPMHATVGETTIEPATGYSPANTPPTRRKVAHLTITAAAALALVFVVLCLVPRREPVEQAGAKPAGVAGAAESDVGLAENSSAFVREFVEANTWTEASLSAFLLQWGQLSNSERVAVRESDPFRSLSRNLQSHILDLRALEASGNGAAVDRIRLLVSFARALDLELPDARA